MLNSVGPLGNYFQNTLLNVSLLVFVLLFVLYVNNTKSCVHF